MRVPTWGRREVMKRQPELRCSVVAQWELQDTECKCHNIGKRQEAGGRGCVNRKEMGT